MKTATQVRVGIIMGSASDLPIMEQAALVLKELEVGFEMTVVSAHRTPERMFTYAREAEGRGGREREYRSSVQCDECDDATFRVQ